MHECFHKSLWADNAAAASAPAALLTAAAAAAADADASAVAAAAVVAATVPAAAAAAAELAKSQCIMYEGIKNYCLDTTQLRKCSQNQCFWGGHKTPHLSTGHFVLV